MAGAALGFLGAIGSLICNGKAQLCLPWSIPCGSFKIEIDMLSGFFLVPIFGLSALAAIYGYEYLQSAQSRKNLGLAWFCFNLLTASMALVVVARNILLFLTAWEIMTLASFFLVVFEHDRAEVRRAGWTYFVASHLGTAFVLVMFLLLGREIGSLDFDIAPKQALSSVTLNWLFVLALIGFGTKAGFAPFHVWLPEAHPAAPSHVSALMSGVMIKTGIYGIVRMLFLLGMPPAWWGWALVVIGVTSGVYGVVCALSQHDIKRLLAYHSVENIGIIALGLGVGVLGVSYARPVTAFLGFAGALLHVLNHALFKGLLFLGAGAVAHASDTREIDVLGGLWKRMPWTGASFLIGAAAICGLPPLNGFISEFLIFLGAFEDLEYLRPDEAGPLLVVLGGLGLIGGLAAACFAKVFGMVFLGQPRSQAALLARDPGPAMRWPMAVLAGACVLIGVLGPLLILKPMLALAAEWPAFEAVKFASRTQWDRLLRFDGWLAPCFLSITSVELLLIAIALGLAKWRKKLLLGRSVQSMVTWDCGYAQPTARMQYTASSFAQPLTEFFRPLLGMRRETQLPEGLFPKRASFGSHTTDIFLEHLANPAFTGIAWCLGQLRGLQSGRVQVYVLYIALALFLLLAWHLGGA